MDLWKLNYFIIFHKFHANVAFPTIYEHFLRNRKYRKYRVIIVSKPKISCNIVWTQKKDIAQGCPCLRYYIQTWPPRSLWTSGSEDLKLVNGGYVQRCLGKQFREGRSADFISFIRKFKKFKSSSGIYQAFKGGLPHILGVHCINLAENLNLFKWWLPFLNFCVICKYHPSVPWVLIPPCLMCRSWWWGLIKPLHLQLHILIGNIPSFGAMFHGSPVWC